MGRGSKTQIRVGENFNKLNQRVKAIHSRKMFVFIITPEAIML